MTYSKGKHVQQLLVGSGKVRAQEECASIFLMAHCVESEVSAQNVTMAEYLVYDGVRSTCRQSFPSLHLRSAWNRSVRTLQRIAELSDYRYAFSRH
jgi:hypothetical protein